ncbi:hypothetical protein [Amycolatopsis kentuckyensis]|uniref:hypothetical protein n=1 Tax=Amycolatopsis kentuckyensis TaxID=218823 RepID=UPI0035650232
MAGSESFSVTVIESDHGAPTLFVHRQNHELAKWTTFSAGDDHDETLSRLGFERFGEWSTDAHGARSCAARRAE